MTAAPFSRVAWIDLLRGIAVVGMIETHVVNTFLDTSFDSTNWLRTLRSYDGLIAPCFLWIAGYVQGLSIRHGIAQDRSVISAARLRRIGFIGLTGFALHAPIWNWLKGDFSKETWRILLNVDILQCLAVSLLLIIYLGHWARKRFDLALTIALTAILCVSAMAANWHTGWMALDPWLNYDTGSLFPFFPVSGYALAGALFARTKPSSKLLLPLSLGTLALGLYFAPYPFQLQHPAFFAERLGWVLLFVWLVWMTAKRVTLPWLQLAGRESLLMYVAHLVLIYAFPLGNAPLDRLIGHTLQPRSAAFLFATILGLCFVLAWLNEKRKTRTTI